MDVNQHVNNAKYTRWISEVLNIYIMGKKCFLGQNNACKNVIIIGYVCLIS